MAASLISAIREKVVKGKSTGLIIFGVAVISIAVMFTYNRFKSGYPF